MIPIRVQVEARTKNVTETRKLHLAFLCQVGTRMPKILKVVSWILAMRRQFDVRCMMIVRPDGEKNVSTVVGGVRWEEGDKITSLKHETEFVSSRMERFEKWIKGIPSKKFSLKVDLVKNDDFGELDKFTSEFVHEKDQSWQQKQRICIICWNSPELAGLDKTHPDIEDPVFKPYFSPIVPTIVDRKKANVRVVNVDPNGQFSLKVSQVFGYDWDTLHPKISIFLQRGADLGRLLHCVKHIFSTNYPNDWMEQMHYLVDLKKSPLIQNVSPLRFLFAQRICSPGAFSEWSNG